MGNKAEYQHWCYYFEKADLARQVGDWQTALELTDEAYAQSLYPQEPTEVLLVAEANAMTGNINRAVKLLTESGKRNPQYHGLFCETIDRFEFALNGELSDNEKSEISTLREKLICD